MAIVVLTTNAAGRHSPCGQTAHEGAMVKARLSEPSLAPHGEAARSAHSHAVLPEELARILAAHRLYIETSRKRGTRASLSAADLAGHDLSGQLLRRIKLDHALLRNANLADADLQQANLIGADLRGVRLAGADLGAARISGANLEAANAEAVVLVGADLEFAVLAKAVLRRARLRGADMSGVNLDGADLREADLREVNLRGASLRHARLDHADLRAARLGGAFPNGASLRAADLKGAYLRVARLDGADLSAADLRNAEGFVSAQLGSALCLTDARLPAELSAEELVKADEAHLAARKQSVLAWNEWRAAHPDTRPNSSAQVCAA